MRGARLFWLLLLIAISSLILYFWHTGDQWLAKQVTLPPPTDPNKSLATTPSNLTPITLLSSPTRGASSNLNPRLAYRLTNTSKTVGQLAEDDKAILLENALIDTQAPMPPIPKHLLAQADAGSFIVQSR